MSTVSSRAAEQRLELKNATSGLCLAIAILIACSWSGAAYAVPAFAVQTGQPCASCHVGGFGPQLTPFGRQFKMEAYTMRGTDAFVVPVSAMAVASSMNTAQDQPAPPAPHYGVNNNSTIDQVSLFLAGGAGQNFGGFFQGTYDGVGRAYAWDNLDLRAVTRTKLGDTDAILGLSLNNAPGVQDTWNTMAAWGFPYTGSDLMPAPGASPILDGGLAQTVIGVSAYAYVNSSFYEEAGLYMTPSDDFLSAVGTPADGSAGRLRNAAPYVRFAYQKSFGDQNFEIGAFGFAPRLYPGGDKSTGKSDLYVDVGLDASYQFTGDGKNIYTFNGRYTYERQRLSASVISGGAANPKNTLNDVRVDASYYWHNLLGGTVQAFNTWGSTDADLYIDNRTLKPDSTGVELQLDATPFANHPSVLGTRFNVRVGVQYIAYTRFDGAAKNYDNTGRNASDNNTLRVFLWSAY